MMQVKEPHFFLKKLSKRKNQDEKISTVCKRGHFVDYYSLKAFDYLYSFITS